eukprot:COSAG02_NODE_2704_length_8197_cov_2.646085_1_plen_89_part_00
MGIGLTVMPAMMLRGKAHEYSTLNAVTLRLPTRRPPSQAVVVLQCRDSAIAQVDYLGSDIEAPLRLERWTTMQEIRICNAKNDPNYSR